MTKFGITQYSIEEAHSYQLMFRIVTTTTCTERVVNGDVMKRDIIYDSLWDIDSMWIQFRYEEKYEDFAV